LKIGLGGYITKELFYDTFGRLNRTKQCIDGKTVEMGFSYDTLDRLRTITYPDGEIVTYEYDSAGRIKLVSGYVEEFEYNPAGQITTARLSNRVTETYHYDPDREWLDHITAEAGQSVLFDVDYDYYPNGLIKSSTSRTNKMNLSYVYDHAGQLTDVTGDLEQHFHYDSTGNITDNSDVGTYFYDSSNGGGGCGSAPNALSCPHAVKSAGTTKLGYDSAGNMTSATGTSAKTRTIKWNKDNEPYSFTDESSVETKARYGDSGERIYRNRTGQVSLYYDPYVDLDYAGSGPVKSTQYYFAGNFLIAKKDSISKRWFHRDQIQSTRLITDPNGQAAAKFDYKPFGEPVAPGGGSADADRRFAGHRLDTDNGLIYMKARYYSPSLGRFISPDPTIPATYQARSTNRYAYAYNNPVSLVDPLGLAPGDPPGIEKTLGVPQYDVPGYGSLHNPIPPAVPPVPPPANLGEFLQIPDRQAAKIRFNTWTKVLGPSPAPLQRIAGSPNTPEFQRIATAKLPIDAAMYTTLAAEGAFAAIELGIGAIILEAPTAIDSASIWLGARLVVYWPRVAAILGMTSWPASRAAEQARAATQSALADTNKVNHIFGKAAHNWQMTGLDQPGNWNLIQTTLRMAYPQIPSSGVYQVTQYFGNYAVTVSGSVVNGAIRIGSAWVNGP
jgi:RHS repeat-associated protein